MTKIISGYSRRPQGLTNTQLTTTSMIPTHVETLTMQMICIPKRWMRQAHHCILHQKKQVSIKSLSYNTMSSYSPLQVHTHLMSNFTLLLVTTTHMFNRLYNRLINQFVPGKISHRSYVLACPTRLNQTCVT